MNLHPQIKTSRAVKVFIVLVVILSLSAFVFRATRNLINNPHIVITYPVPGTVVADPFVKITGVAEDVSKITMYGRDIFIDDGGNFSESLLLAPGYNIIEVSVEDRFGKRETERTSVIYR